MTVPQIVVTRGTNATTVVPRDDTRPAQADGEYNFGQRKKWRGKQAAQAAEDIREIGLTYRARRDPTKLFV